MTRRYAFPSWILMVIALFIFPGCSEDSSDGGNSSGDDDDAATDDDAAVADDDVDDDDDASDDDADDDLDDDAGDDDTAPPPEPGTVPVDGGYFAPGAAGVVVDGDGVYHAFATHARTLHHYTIDGDTVTREPVAFRAYEPDVAIDADGHLHVAYVDRAAPEIAYATNRTGSWTRETVTVFDPFNFSDLNITLDSDGLPRVVAAQDTLSYAERDAGGSWNVTVFPETTGYVRQADVAFDAAGRPNVVYSAMSSDVYVDLAVRDGDDWTTTRLAEHAQATGPMGDCFTNWDYMGVAAAADDENVYATYALDEFYTCILMFEFAADVHLATIDADGSVATEQIDRSENMFVLNSSLVAGDSGVHVAYGFEAFPIFTPIPSVIRFWDATDGPVTAVVPGLTLAGIGLAVGDAPRVLWFHPDGARLELSKPVGPLWTATELHRSVPVTGPMGTAVDADGLRRAIYVDARDPGLRYAVETDAGWTTERVWDLEYAPEAMALATDANGAAHVAFRGEDSILYYLTNASGDWAIETVDTSDDTGNHCRIAVDSLGRPRIAYVIRDELGDPHWLVRVATREGGVWTQEDVAGSLGAPFAFTLDAQNFAHLAYGSYEAWYARETAGGWQFEALGLQSIDYAAIALDAQGEPHIAFSSSFGQFLDYVVKNGGAWTSVRLAWNNMQRRVGPLAIDLTAADEAFIVYHHGDELDLRMLTNQGGTPWQRDIVDGDDVGDDPFALVDGANVRLLYRGAGAVWALDVP
ncbi:MAG: hypothetical protein IT350_00050 [Deltaproteobacteria bacterium]|nr:hypothetical protein [Deltaproteobacteria bacterium]